VVPHVHGGCSVIAVEQLESNGDAAWVVEEPDPVVEQHRRDVRPGRNEIPVIQSIPWFGPATNPSSDIVKCQSTLPAAVCRSVSAIYVNLTLS
jgi:hypothetical protein